MRVISLGWGVQSWTIAAMTALGDLSPVDFAIHADTTWERQSTYQFAAKWTGWLEERGVKVVTVRATEADRVGQHIPGYTISIEDDIYGQVRRQCTNHWKIIPMRRYIAAELERLRLPKSPGQVAQLIGITLDEWQRAKDSDVKYVRHEFPLLDRRMTRADCIHWLDGRGLEVPGKSACTFCPYHNKHAWEAMKRENGPDWQQAVEVDEAIRDKRPPYPLFVHNARKPLPEAVQIPEDYGATQLDMFGLDLDNAPCDSGYCFL